MKVVYFHRTTKTWRTIYVKDDDPKAKQVLTIMGEAPVESNPLILTGRLLKMLWKLLTGTSKARD